MFTAKPWRGRDIETAMPTPLSPMLIPDVNRFSKVLITISMYLRVTSKITIEVHKRVSTLNQTILLFFQLKID
jgi:hypothetical protein